MSDKTPPPPSPELNPEPNPQVLSAPPEDAGEAQAEASQDQPAIHAPAPMTWSQWLNLSALDDIDPDNVRNSTAFKLGALAGLLPALSVMSLTQFLTPEQLPASKGGSGDFTFWSAVLVLISSALVGGSVAFFWAENRLRTIFTYGIAGPTVVLSMFLTGISNLAANKRVENVVEASAQKFEKEAKKVQDEAAQKANTAVQKVLGNVGTNNTTPTSLPTEPPSMPNLSPAPSIPAAANLDLGAP